MSFHPRHQLPETSLLTMQLNWPRIRPQSSCALGLDHPVSVQSPLPHPGPVALTVSSRTGLPDPAASTATVVPLPGRAEEEGPAPPSRVLAAAVREPARGGCCPHPRWRPRRGVAGAAEVPGRRGTMAAAEERIPEDADEDEEEAGVDTERPILQVDNYVFAGEYEDTLGTCVIFEENVEHGDAEGSSKTVLKYKCHTMKKLSMTRTLLTEKKEGEESVGGVEWLQIKDNDFSYRPNMICSFLHENEDDDIGAPASDKSLELEEEEIQMKDNSSLGYEQGKSLNLEVDNSGPLLDDIPSSETDGYVFMETQDTTLEISPR
nr:general transcription factor 3C polypeptide 6 [Vulpes vulpes]